MTVLLAAALNSLSTVYTAFTAAHYFSDTYSDVPEGALHGLLICIIAVVAVFVAAWSSNRPLSNLTDIMDILWCMNRSHSSTVFPAPTLPANKSGLPVTARY